MKFTDEAIKVACDTFTTRRLSSEPLAVSMKAAIEAAIQAMWVSVKEKLPLEALNNTVLATDGYNYETAYYFRKNFVTTDGLFHSVTHWMPLHELKEIHNE